MILLVSFITLMPMRISIPSFSRHLELNIEEREKKREKKKVIVHVDVRNVLNSIKCAHLHVRNE